MQRLILVYNPRSSHAKKIEEEVLAPARELAGWTVGKYAVKPTNVDDNARQLAKVLEKGDLVVAAGGDGTATIAVNGVMQAKKKVTLAVLGYGNFNDHARTLRSGGSLTEIVQRFEKGRVRGLYPLDIKIDGKHWRYAACYATIGLFAESTQVFEAPAVRKKLQTGKKSLVFSVKELAKWYFGNKKKEFVAAVRINGEVAPRSLTDIMAVNSATVARVMRGGKTLNDPRGYLLATGRLGSFWRLGWFMGRSILWRVPGKMIETVKLDFEDPATVRLQAEGEYMKLMRVREVEIEKSKQAIRYVV